MSSPTKALPAGGMRTVIPRSVRLMRTLSESGPRATQLALQAKRYGAKQKLREFAGLCELVARQRPRVVVEIGTMRGGTLWAWCQLARPDALIVSIDLPGGRFGGGYPDQVAGQLEGYARASQRVRLIRGDSHSDRTFQELQEILGGRQVGLLFIDGDHSYSGVRKDWEMYHPLVCSGGLIAFHDILPCRPEDGDVSRLWTSIREQRRCAEFVDRRDTAWRGPWGGIGVVFV